MPRTGHEMIVHHSCSLHERVTDSAAHEIEPALEKVLAHGVGFGRPRGKFFPALPTIDFLFSPDEAPDVFVKGSELLLHRQKGFGVSDGGRDFQAVTDDSGVS